METRLNRRTVLAALVGGAIAPAVMAAPGTPVEVWKDPSCGCCGDWVKHLEANGFSVKVFDTGNNAVRSRLGIDPKYGSCHTAVVGGYVIEGHVPAEDIRKLLAQKPNARGLAVPGMKIGSPGMDTPAYNGRRDTYEVLLLAKDGSATVWRRYEGNHG